MEIYSVILAGGFGRRLTPLSTVDKPKQFHDLNGEGISLFQQTVLRALKISLPKHVLPVANIKHKNLVLSQLAAANFEVAQNVIFETEAKNTAHAIYLAAKKIGKGLMVVLPSDHAITGSFNTDIEKAVKLAEKGKIVAFGIEPESADTNFGYILGHAFHEKPELHQAQVLLAEGALWNSGIFVFKAETVLSEFEDFYGNNIPAISFDKAVMEKTDKLATIKAGFHWADLGSWEVLNKLKYA